MKAIAPSWILMPNRVESDGWADPPLAARARDVTPTRRLSLALIALAILAALAWSFGRAYRRFTRHLESRIRAHFGGIGSRIVRRLADQGRRLLPINTLCFVGG